MKTKMVLDCVLRFPREWRFFATIVFIVMGLGSFEGWTSKARAAELNPLGYHHPGLVVDLGVGLWAWPIPCDADGDGDFDLLVSCPDKPSNGIWMFENASGDTAKTKMPVFKPGRLISKTTHYVMPSYVDGKMRVLSPGVEYQNFTSSGTEKKVKLPIEAKFHKPQGKQPKGPKMRHNQWRYVDYDGDGKLDLVVAVEDWSYYGWDDAWNAEGKWQNGPLHGWIYVLRNRGTNEVPDYAKPTFVEVNDKRLDVFGCPSPNFEDFDGDGDLDLLCGEFLDRFTYFENVGTRKSPRYAPGRRLNNAEGKPLRMDLEMIVPIAFDWDRDGDKDLIVGDEDGRVAFLENVGLNQDEANSKLPLFAGPKYFEQEADMLKCGALATPVATDWDGDGDIDLLSGNTAGYIEFFENLSGPRIGSPKWNRPVRLQAGGKVFRVMAGVNGSIQGPAEAKWGYTTFNVADWDADGLPDIVLNSILGRVVWLRNIGSRRDPMLAGPEPIEVEWENEQPHLAWGWLRPKGKELLTQWRTTPALFDYNGDGLVDIAMLDHEGYLAFFQREKKGDRLVLKAPQRVFVDGEGNPLRLNAESAGRSGRRKLSVTDWDGDGRFDFLLNSSNADLWKQVSLNDGKWVMKNAGTLAERNIEGHDVSPTTADFDGDSIPDFVGGAEDGRMYHLKNPRSVILQSEFVYEKAPFPSCHASTVVESSDGTLIAAWFGGTREKDPDVGIWLSRREKDAWSTPVEVANGKEHLHPQANVLRYPTWNPVLFQAANRESPLQLFYKVGPSPSAWWGMVRTSGDEGRSWSAPERLPDGMIGPVKNKPVQLANGDILSSSSMESDDKQNRWQVHFERSSDGGKSWEKIGPVNDGIEIQAIQPSILFLGGQHLRAIGRSRQDRIFEIDSLDGGKSWGKMSLGDLPNNNSGTDALTLRDGRHLIVYNHVGGTPGKWGGKRTPLNLSTSVDGRTWHASLILENEPGEYSYPAMIQTRDGRVHVVYTWRRERIKHVVIDPNQLREHPMVDGQWPAEAK